MINRFKQMTIPYTKYQNTKRSIPQDIKKPQWFGKSDPIYSVDKYAFVFDKEEMLKLRQAATLAKKCLKKAEEIFKQVETGEELDRILTEFIVQQDAYPSGIGFMGFPKTICISPNDILVHGIPNGYKFRNGDIVNLDITVYKDGFYGDNSVTVIKGETDPLLQ